MTGTRKGIVRHVASFEEIAIARIVGLVAHERQRGNGPHLAFNLRHFEGVEGHSPALRGDTSTISTPTTDLPVEVRPPMNQTSVLRMPLVTLSIAAIPVGSPRNSPRWAASRASSASSPREVAVCDVSRATSASWRSRSDMIRAPSPVCVVALPAAAVYA